MRIFKYLENIVNEYAATREYAAEKLLENGVVMENVMRSIR